MDRSEMNMQSFRVAATPKFYVAVLKNYQPLDFAVFPTTVSYSRVRRRVRPSSRT